jgi:hypothetical protein
MLTILPPWQYSVFSIQALLSAPNPDDPLSDNIAKHWKSNEAEAVETGTCSCSKHNWTKWWILLHVYITHVLIMGSLWSCSQGVDSPVHKWGMTAKCCSRCNNTSIVWGRLNTPLAWCEQICEMLQWGKKQKASIVLCTCGCSCSVRCSAHE